MRPLMRFGIAAMAVAILPALANHASAAGFDHACKDPHLALVIGNAAYPDLDAPLKDTLSGARSVAKTLRDLGYETVEQENLNRARMRAAFDTLLAQVRPRSVVVLYLSGFGVQHERHTFFLPVDATIWSEADIPLSGFSIERLLVELAAKGAQAEVLAIDAARRNPFERRFRASGSGGLAAISGIDNLVAILSAQPDRVFSPSDVDANLFAESLSTQMSRPDATAQSAVAAVQADLERKPYGTQKPWTSSTVAEDLPMDSRHCAERASPGVATASSRELPATSPKHDATAPAPQVVIGGSKQKAIPDAAAADTSSNEAPARISEARLGNSDRTSDARLDVPELLDEVHDRLFEQAFDPGAVGSDKMTDAIRAYAKRAGLPDVGYATRGLLSRLREAASLKPWGAIAYAAEAGRWGMSWASPTRQQALAVAKARCAADKCDQVISFYGDYCGALALSPKGWAMTWRPGSDASHKAALLDCGKHGATCKLIGAVCADGSDKSNLPGRESKG